MNKSQKNNKGFALLLSLIVSSIALSIGMSMLHITLKQLTLGTTTRGSEIAFQAANAGMECLRYLRNRDSNNFVEGKVNIQVDCLGETRDFVYSNPEPPIHKYQMPDLNWNTADGDLCIDIEMYVIDASGGVDVPYTFPNGPKNCEAGDVCTFGFVRGYNRSCGETSSSIFTVQRELTIEF